MRKKLTKIIPLLLIATIALEGVHIYFANRMAADSLAASRLRAQIAVYEEKNLHLRSEIVEVSSFEMIASRAAQLGFVESDDTISLLSPQEFAARR